jgi:capsular exopolysaccharide synthesis family protein
LDDHCQLALKRLGWPGQEGKHAIRTLGLTSCRGGEGVSTVAAHLATAAAARQEGKVVLIDANLGRPAVTQIFGVPPSPGLFECVIEDEPVLDALHPTTMENLHVLAAGKIQGSPARVYDAENLLDVVADLAGGSVLAIFDLPPVRQVSCANRLCAALDGVVLVVEAESAAWETALRVKEILNRAGARIVGAILNKRREA